MENPVTVQVVVSKCFFVLTVIREILTLLTILLFEIAKNLWFHWQRYIADRFRQRSPSYRPQLRPFWSANVSARVFPAGVFTAFVASQRSLAAVSSLPAAMSFFCRYVKSAFLLPPVLSNLTRPRLEPKGRTSRYCCSRFLCGRCSSRQPAKCIKASQLVLVLEYWTNVAEKLWALCVLCV